MHPASTRPFGQAPVQELREVVGSCTGYVVLFLTDNGGWRVLLDPGTGRPLRLVTGTAALRVADQARALRAHDAVLVGAFSLAEGRLLAPR